MYFRIGGRLCCAPATSTLTTMKPIDSLSDDEFAHLVQRSVALPDAPPSLVRAAIDLWPGAQPSALQSAAEAAWRLVTAVLSFDSWAQPPVALGMRAAPSSTRHLLFSAQGRDIDLRISPAAEHFALTGQILGRAGQAVLLDVMRRGTQRKSQIADGAG